MDDEPTQAMDETTTADIPNEDRKEKEKHQNNNSNRHNNKNAPRKRKRDGNDHYAKTYENAHYEPIPPDPQDISIPGVPNVVHTTTPGTPLRQFARSFRAELSLDNAKTQIVHHHANGLCVVTAGESTSSAKIERIDFLVEAADHCSAAERRKKQSKMLKKNAQKGEKGVLTPTTEIARLHLADNNKSVVSLYACVWGTLLEVNTTLTPERLQKDPLMEGYLAVILPTGPFPPKKKDSNDNTPEEKKRKQQEDATKEEQEEESKGE